MVLGKKFKYILTPSLWKSSGRPQMPSNNVLVAFKLKYPKAKQARWKQIDVFKWQVTFKILGNVRWGLFSSDGTWMETLHAVSFKEIPHEIQVKYESVYSIDGLKYSNKIQTPLRTIFEIHCNTGLYDLKLLYNEMGKMVGKMLV